MNHVRGNLCLFSLFLQRPLLERFAESPYIRDLFRVVNHPPQQQAKYWVLRNA
jgi:hypothetical protein